MRGRVKEQNPLLQDPFFRRFFNVPQNQQLQERETQSTGSGVIIDAAQGYVLTNGHVAANATRIEVTTKDNRRLTAKLIGTDNDTDVAVLQVPAGNLTALPMGDSDRLQVGDFVLAIGNPFGLGQTVTSGIVSALGGIALGFADYEDFIQTDASITRASGGPLVNPRGECVRSHRDPDAGRRRCRIGFAVPINMARKVMEQISDMARKRGRSAWRSGSDLGSGAGDEPTRTTGIIARVVRSPPNALTAQRRSGGRRPGRGARRDPIAQHDRLAHRGDVELIRSPRRERRSRCIAPAGLTPPRASVER